MSQSSITQVCWECGKHFPPGMHFRMTDQGPHCYTECKNPTPTLNEIYCRRLMKLLQLDDVTLKQDQLVLLAEFVINTIKMREAQKDYFRHRKRSALDAAMDLEKQVDAYLQHVNQDAGTKAAANQPSLF